MSIQPAQKSLISMVLGIAIGLGSGLAIFFLIFHSPTGDQQDHIQFHSQTDLDQLPEELPSFNVDRSAALGDALGVNNDYRVAWDRMRNDEQIHMGHIGSVVEVILGVVAEEGLAVLNELAISTFDVELRSALISSVIHTLAEKIGFQELFDEAADLLQDSTRREVLRTLVTAWAREDPVRAFETIAGLENDHHIVKLWESVILEWANSDPETLSESIDSMPPSIQPTANWFLMLSIAQDEPARAVERLPDLLGTLYENLLSVKIAENWRSRDFEKALTWVASHRFSSDRIRNVTTATILFELIEEDPKRALELALEQQPDQFGKGPEAYLIEQVAMTNIDQALDMLPHVRKGSSSFYAHMAVGTYLCAQHKFAQAVELAENIAPESRHMYYQRVFQRWATISPGDLFDSLSQLPEELQSRAALGLVETRPSDLVLSEAQEIQVKRYLTKEDYSTHLDRISRQWDLGPRIMDPDIANPYLGEELRSKVLRIY